MQVRDISVLERGHGIRQGSQTHLEEPANRLVAQVMEVQVCDPCHRFINQTDIKRTSTLGPNQMPARMLIHKYTGTPRWPLYPPVSDPLAQDI